MDFMYFVYQYLPSFMNWLGYLDNATPIKIPTWDIPKPNEEQFLDSVGSTLCQAAVGLTMPGFEVETLIETLLLSDGVQINDPVNVIQMLREYGSLQPGAGLVGLGLEITKQSLKQWCNDTFHMQGDTLRNALMNTPATFKGANAVPIAINLRSEVYQRSKDLAKLLANNHISMDVDIDNTIELDRCENINALNEAVGNALYQIGLVTPNTLMIDPNFSYARATNTFLLRHCQYQNIYVVYIRNTINQKMLPCIMVLGDGVTYGGDIVPATINNFTLNLSTETEHTMNFLRFSLKAHLDNVGGNLENLNIVHNLRMTRLKSEGGVLDSFRRGEAVSTPYDGYGENEPLFNYVPDTAGINGGDVLTNDYLETAYRMTYLGTGIDDFFNGMTPEQVLDPDSYEIYNPVNDSRIDDHQTYAPTWDPSIKDKLILDEYDIATVNDDSASVDRDRDRTFVLNPASIEDLVSAVPAIADVLFPTVGVYPWDIPNQRTLTDVPLSIAQAGANIADKVKDDDLYVGTPDAKLVSATGVYGLFTIYKVSTSNLSALGAKLWSQDFIDNFHPFKNDPSEALISLIGYPMDISAGSSSDIICGNYNCSPASGNIISNLFQDHSMGSIVIPEKFGNFMDYSPYTKISLYLPFVGLVDLDTDEVMGATLKVDYRVELLTGTAIAKVTVIKGAMNAVLYQYSCNVGFTLPLSASDFSRTYTSLMTGAGTMALGAMSGNPALMAGGVAAMANSVASAKPDINKTGGMSGNSGMCGNMNAYVIIDTVVPDKPGGYEQLKGVPSNQLRQIGQMSGFVKLDEFQLNNISATDEEKAEIDRLLRSGVIV